MQLRWTLQDLVEEVALQIAALPLPRNGQVRAVPDDRTVRYYGTIGLLDKPIEMRGRTALYGKKHIAQVVAIKRLQALGRSLAEIQQLWPTLDDVTLARMSGVAFTDADPTAPRAFWKSADADSAGAVAAPARQIVPGAGPATHVELAPNVILTLSGIAGSAISLADVRALRAAAAPLLTELASRRLASPLESSDD